VGRALPGSPCEQKLHVVCGYPGIIQKTSKKRYTQNTTINGRFREQKYLAYVLRDSFVTAGKQKMDL